MSYWGASMPEIKLLFRNTYPSQPKYTRTTIRVPYELIKRVYETKKLKGYSISELARIGIMLLLEHIDLLDQAMNQCYNKQTEIDKCVAEKLKIVKQ